MRSGATEKNRKRAFFCSPLRSVVCLFAILSLFSVAVYASAEETSREQSVAIDPSKITFPTHRDNQAIKDLGVALQRHDNGRIKTYFQAGEAWQIGANAFSFSNDFATGAYAAEKGIKVTMLDEKGNRQFWINADKACVFLNEKIGKCFGFVKLENPMVEIFGTNLLWNTSSTNLFTVEKNVTLKIKQLDNDVLKGKK